MAGVQAAPPTVEQVKELRQRYEQAIRLYQEGEYSKSIELFEHNLAVDSASKGSLLFSGLAYLQLGQFEKADERFVRFLKLEPLNEVGLIGAIKARQTLGQAAEVERLRKILQDERDSGKNPRLNALLSYERQTIRLPDGSQISILENLDKNGTYVWAYLLVASDKKVVKRRLELAPAPPETAGVKFLLGEVQSEGGKTTGYKIHRFYTALPSFEKAREEAVKLLESKQ